MALQDCFQKLGDQISSEDRAQIESDVEAGMSAHEAVRAALRDSAQDLRSIVATIEEHGGIVKRRPNPLVDAREMQMRNLQKLQDERLELQKKIQRSFDKLQNISDAEDWVRTYPERADFFVADQIDLDNLQHLNRILSSILFESTRTAISTANRLGITGNSPKALVESFIALRESRVDETAKLVAYQRQNASIDDRIRTVFHGERRNPVLDQRGNYIIMEPQRPGGPDQGDLFSDADVPQSQKATEAKANYKVRVKNEEVGTLPTGLNVVKSAEDAAHVMAPIRRSATEGFWALVLDENDQVISAIRHSIGTYDGTSVYPSVMAGAILTTEGARKVWFAHNHPSGVAMPSQADERITKRLTQTLQDTDVTVAGHIIIGAGGREYSHIDDSGQLIQSQLEIKPLARRMQVSITERVLRAALPDAEAVTGPAAATNLINRMDPSEGLLILDNRHRPVGFFEMTSDDMKSLRTTRGHQRIMQAMSELNGAAIFAISHVKDEAIFENLGLWANQNEYRVLDTFYRDDQGLYKSMAAGGYMPGRAGRSTYHQIDRPKLQALHNLTAENLTFADNLGGLSVPSIALTPEGQNMDKFGEITLIGTKDLVNPQQVPLFDADAYAVRFPKANYQPAKVETVQGLLDEVRPHAKRIAGSEYSGLPDFLWEYMYRRPDPERLIEHMLGDNTAKAWYLAERHGLDPKPKLDDVVPRYTWGWHDDIVAFFQGDLSDDQLDWDNPRRRALYKKAGRIVSKAIREYFTSRSTYGATGRSPEAEARRAASIYNRSEAFIASAGILNDDGSLVPRVFDTLRRDVARKGSKNINDVDTKTYLDSRIKKLGADVDFRLWAENKVLNVMSDPRIKVGNKWEPYTLENIVRKMKRKLAGTEAFFPTEGMLRAKAAARIKTMDEARQRALKQIGTEEEVEAARDEAQGMVRDWIIKISQFWPFPADNVLTWDRSSDAAREAIAFWAQNFERMGTEAALDMGLRRAGFEGPFGDWIINEGLDAIAAFMQAPVPYFEAKPQRAVLLNEFAGAVIPNDASPETRAILQKHGIVYKEYQGGRESKQNRAAALEDLQRQLVDAGERTLFQSEIGFYSGLLNAAQALDLERAPAKDMLGRLRKMPGASTLEMEALDLPGFIEAKGDQMLTKDEIIAYVISNGIVVLEAQLGGEYVPEPNLNATYNSDYEKFEKFGYLDRWGDYDLSFIEYTNTYSEHTFDVIEDRDAGNVMVTPDGGETWLDIDAPINNQTVDDAEKAIVEYIERDTRGEFVRTAENDSAALPYGENFREIILYMAPVPQGGRPYQWEDWTGGHHDENNVIAFFLATDRIGPNGERILMLEEIQSDWHQRGKRYGYATPVPDIPEYRIRETETQWIAVDENEQPISFGTLPDGSPRTIAVGKGVVGRGRLDGLSGDDVMRSFMAAGDYMANYLRNLRSEMMRANLSAVPEGPFKGNAWVTLALKRAIRLAAEQGYDQVAWSTGDVINERAGFTEITDAVRYDPRDSTVYFYNDVGVEVTNQNVIPDDLREFLGDRQYERLMQQVDERAEMWETMPALEAIDDFAPVTTDYVEDNLNQAFTKLLLDTDEETAGNHLMSRAQAGELFVAVGPNGELLRDEFGHISVSQSRDAMEAHLMDRIFREFEDLPTLTNLGLRTTSPRGEKMSRFYDQTVPNLMNKAVRKLDPQAKVRKNGQVLPGAMNEYAEILDRRHSAQWHWSQMEEAIEYGARGAARQHRQLFDEQIERLKILEERLPPPPEVHVLDITDKVREMALLGQTLYQDPHRGSITFDAENRAVIRLAESKNLSTFLHETGHLYLEIMGDLAQDAVGPRQIVSDYQKILEYLGVNSRREITREHHEKWARSFEKYLQEGKAPSPETRYLFAAFAQWLTKIYEKLTSLRGIELTDDIRGVMDRMLATDQAITAAESQQEFRPIYSSAEQMGVSQEVFDLYKSWIAQAHQDAFDKEARKMLDFLEREAKVWWQTEREKVLAEVRAEVYAQPVYRALSMLQKGENPDGSTPERAIFKLDRDDLIDRYGKEFIKRLPGRGRYGVYAAKGGVDADVAANIFGFNSADEMIQAILRAGRMDAVIEAETDMRMRERFPDPAVDGTLAADAVNAVHNEKRAQILAAELRALRREMRKDRKVRAATKREAARIDREARAANAGMLPSRGELAIIKKLSRDAISATQIRDVNPNKYRIAEAKAGRAAFNAAAKGDYQTAYNEKLKQIRNHEMYRAAVRASEESIATQKYLKGFDSKTTQRRLGKAGEGLLEQILAVIEGIDLRNVSLAQVDRETAMAELLDAADEGLIVIPPATLNKLQSMGTNWKNLTVQEFRDIRDVVKQLDHKASEKAKGVLNDEKVELETAAADIAESVLENNKFVPAGVAEPLKSEKAKRALKAGVMTWLRPSSIARVLDQSGFGALTKWIIVPIRRAYAEKLIPMLQKSQEDVTALYQKHYNKKELGKMHSRVWIEAMGENLSKADMLSIALNWGNAGNRAALLGGVKRDGTAAYSEQGVQAVLAKLDARDWAFVQDVWDYIDSYWPALRDAEQRRRGIAPQRVEALPFTVTSADGIEVTLKGGYYPLVYDRRHSERIKAAEIEDLYKKIGNGVFITAQTRAGSTFERVKNHGMVVRLGLHTIDLHLREVIRDIAIGDEVNFIKRLLNNRDVRKAFNDTNNDTALEALNLWLTDAAVGELPAEGPWEQGVAWIRTGFVKAKLGWNLLTTALQLTGVFQTIAVIGSKSYAMGLGKFLSNPTQMYRFVMEQSAFMKTRYGRMGAFDKDVIDTQVHLNTYFGPFPTRLKQFGKRASALYFYPIAKMQSVVDVTTWLGAYWKGRNLKGLSDADATLYADTQVEGAQTSGFFSDRSGLERGTLGSKKNRQAQWVRIWTTLISYMLAKGNIAYEKGVAFKRRPTAWGAVQLATDLMLLYTMEGIAAALIYDQFPDDEDDESWGWWTAKVTIDSFTSGIPLVREIPAARFGGGNTAIGTFTDDIYTLGQQIGQGEVDEALIKNLNNVGGTLFHYPSSQINRGLDALWEEGDVEFWEYFTGVRD